jgi:hypothetical protein
MGLLYAIKWIHIYLNKYYVVDVIGYFQSNSDHVLVTRDIELCDWRERNSNFGNIIAFGT